MIAPGQLVVSNLLVTTSETTSSPITIRQHAQGPRKPWLGCLTPKTLHRTWRMGGDLVSSLTLSTSVRWGNPPHSNGYHKGLLQA